MTLLTHTNSLVLWQDIVKHAENRCSIALKKELEAYLVSLLNRYTDQPKVAKQVIATAYLEALNLRENERNISLQHIGDQCLLYAGLFPRMTERKLVKINYFVDLGRAAYATISQTTNDLYDLLALQFVVLMDVLQSIRPYSDLLPLEAYEQWNELHSQRALRILREYTSGMPIKHIK